MIARVFSALAALFLVATISSPAEARWLRAESQKFVVYSDGDEQALRQYVANLEDYDVILRFRLGIPQDRETSRKLEIYLVGKRGDLKIVNPDIPDSIAGFYSASMYDIYAIATRPQRKDKLADDVIFHEYAHHFMFAYLPNSYPGWYVEGFAEYFAPIEQRDNAFIVGGVNQGRAHSLLNERWVSVEDLLNKRPSDFETTDERASYYAQAWLLSHYMMTDPARMQLLNRYLGSLSSDKPSSETWTEVTGDSMAELTNKLQAYKKSTMVATGFNRTEKRKPVAITVTTLPPSADELLLLRQRMMGQVGDGDEGAFLTDIRRIAAKYPGDRFAELVLARAEFLYGDFDKGRALVGDLLARNPDDAAALQLIGIALVDKAYEDGENEAEMFKEARKYLARAYQVDNDDYRTMVYFTLTQQTQRDYPNDNTVQLLAEAYVRAPQVANVRILLARGLMRQKRWDEATLILNPLVNDPHGGGASRTAQGLIRQIKANQ
jgi:predicted Zn-dependent protease